MSVTIRKAEGDDFKSVFILIQEFAEFEKLRHEVKLTAEEFQNDGIAELFRCIVAEEQGNIIGYALFFPISSSCQGRATYLEDLYVSPHKRGMGIGKNLYNSVVKASPCVGSVVLKFACLEWNKKAVLFYEKLGARNLTQSMGSHVWRFDLEVLEQVVKNRGCVAINAVEIRKAQSSDLPALYQLAKEYAVGQKQEQVIPLQEFESLIFGSNPALMCLVAEKAGHLCGYATYHEAYSTFQGCCVYLGEVYVNDGNRRKGVATALVTFLAQECVAIRSCKLQFMTSAEDIAAINLFRKLGAINLTEEQQWLFFVF